MTLDEKPDAVVGDTWRDAWFAGWKAAKLHSMQENASFAGARLEGNGLVWANVPQPPNPFPELPVQPQPPRKATRARLTHQEQKP